VAGPPNLAVYSVCHCGQLILRKINKLDATRCQIRGKNAQNSISAGVPTHTPLRELRTPDTLAVFKGPTSKGREGGGEEVGKGEGPG